MPATTPIEHPDDQVPLDLAPAPISDSQQPHDGPDRCIVYKTGPGCELSSDQFEVTLNLTRKVQADEKGNESIISINKSFTNLITILKLDPEYGSDLRMSEMGQRVYHHGAEVNTDTFVSYVRDYVTRHYLGVEFSREATKDAIALVGEENLFHPVRDMLNALPAWDRTPRLERVPTWILKTDDNPLYGTFFKKTLISMVARVMRPGCDVHTILVLAGDQGTGKSTFMKTLAINPDWFSCSKLDIKDKDGRLNLHFVWITELAEIDKVLSRVGDESIMKDFITDPRDLYRAPYAPAPKMHPRSSVMVGTTNEPEFLRDKTGSRRYWPMTTQGKIDLETLREIREQLWAEAFHLYNQGESWWLSDEEEAMRRDNANSYEIEDPLEDFLREALVSLACTSTFGASLKEMLEKLPLEHRRIQSQRISNILKRFGWEKRTLRIRGEKTTRWFPPDNWCLPALPATGPAASHFPWPVATPGSNPALTGGTI